MPDTIIGLAYVPHKEKDTSDTTEDWQRKAKLYMMNSKQVNDFFYCKSNLFPANLFSLLDVVFNTSSLVKYRRVHP